MKIDKRKQRSEAKLFQALAQEYRQGTPFAQIEVSQLCQLAGVSRATFYRHHETIEDVLIVEFLILITEFEQRIDQLEQVDFTSGSAVLIGLVYDRLELLRMVKWSNTYDQVTSLITGAVQTILRLRDYNEVERPFISNFVGTAVLNFALQIAQAVEPMPQVDALKLFRLLMPSHLGIK